MMAESERRKQIEYFLSGKMNTEDLTAFSKMLDLEPQLRSELEHESGIDALLYNAGTSTETDQSFITALDKVMGKPVSSGKKKNVLAGHWMQLYAIAATLLLFIACAYISIIRKGSTVQPHLVNAGYSHSGKSIYQLSDGAFFLSEEGSKVRIMRGENNFPEHVILSQGNICFDISGIEPDTITVATPHAAVVLSKRTVTRLVVTELETEVTVLEGNAEVIHRYHRDKQQKLAAGGTVYADFNAVQVAQNLAPEVCQSRTSIFKTYISWVQKQACS